MTGGARSLEEAGGFAWPGVLRWALAPDDALLAVQTAAGDIVCVDVATAREVARLPAASGAAALAWLSGELLLVLRPEGVADARMVVHAMPDGGEVGDLFLPGVDASRYRLAVAAHGRSVLVGGRGLGRGPWYVVRTDTLGVVAEIGTRALGGLPRGFTPETARVTLHPDGAVVGMALHGQAATRDDPTRVVGCLDWRSGRTVWRRGGRRLDAARVHWTGRAGLLSYWNPALPSGPGRLQHLDTASGTWRYDSARERPDAPTPFLGSTLHGLDLHPDGARVLVAGAGTLQVVDLRQGAARGIAEVPHRSGRMGALWLGDGDTALVLASPTWVGGAPEPGTLSLGPWDPVRGVFQWTIQVPDRLYADKPRRLLRSHARRYLLVESGEGPVDLSLVPG